MVGEDCMQVQMGVDKLRPFQDEVMTRVGRAGVEQSREQTSELALRSLARDNQLTRLCRCNTFPVPNMKGRCP